MRTCSPDRADLIAPICLENKVPEKTINYKVTNLVSTIDGCVNSIHVQQRIDHLKEKILLKNPAINLDEEIEKRTSIIFNCNHILLKFITGKNYLFPLIKQRISSHYNLTVTRFL